jgi:hypothetical protein
MNDENTPGDVAQQGAPSGAENLRIPGFPAAQGRGGEMLKAQTRVRWSRSDVESDLSNRRQASHQWDHASPRSVLVGAVGNSWKEDSKGWARVTEMCEYAKNEFSAVVLLQEFQDRCFEPYDALGTMRNEIMTHAIAGGFEFVMMIDNDVMPTEDTLVRLMMHDEPIIAPYVEEPIDPENPAGPRRVLHGPFREPHQGTYKVKWHVLSMVLYKTVFAASLGTDFWQDSIGGDEGYHYAKMYAQSGVQPRVDSDIVLKVGGKPLYPLTVKKSDQYEEEWQRRREQFNSVPYRGPIWPTDPRVTPEKTYLPFLQPPPPPEPGAAPVMDESMVTDIRERVADGKLLTKAQSQLVSDMLAPVQQKQVEGNVNGSQPEPAEPVRVD